MAKDWVQAEAADALSGGTSALDALRAEVARS